MVPLTLEDIFFLAGCGGGDEFNLMVGRDGQQEVIGAVLKEK